MRMKLRSALPILGAMLTAVAFAPSLLAAGSGPLQVAQAQRSEAKGGGAGAGRANRGGGGGNRGVRSGGRQGNSSADRGPRRGFGGTRAETRRGPSVKLAPGNVERRQRNRGPAARNVRPRGSVVIRPGTRRPGAWRSGRRFSWAPGFTFYLYDGYYYGDCAWLRRKARATGSQVWWRRYRRCRIAY